MNALELKPILLALTQQVDDLRVNQAVLLAKINGAPTLGDLLDVRKATESRTKTELSELRAWIEAL